LNFKLYFSSFGFLKLNRKLNAYLQGKEAETNNKVGGPVDTNGQGSGRWPGRLVEQLGHQEPGDGARAGGEHNHKEDDQHNAEVGDPQSLSLRK